MKALYIVDLDGLIHPSIQPERAGSGKARGKLIAELTCIIGDVNLR